MYTVGNTKQKHGLLCWLLTCVMWTRQQLLVFVFILPRMHYFGVKSNNQKQMMNQHIVYIKDSYLMVRFIDIHVHIQCNKTSLKWVRGVLLLHLILKGEGCSNFMNLCFSSVCLWIVMLYIIQDENVYRCFFFK